MAMSEAAPDGVSRTPLFEPLAIWDARGARRREHQGVYPVVYLSLNDVKKPSWTSVTQPLRTRWPRSIAAAPMCSTAVRWLLAEPRCTGGVG